MGAFAHAACHLSALAFDVSFQFIAIFIVMYITCNNECQTITLRTFFYRFLFLDDEMWKKVFYMRHIVCIVKPIDELGTFFRSNTINVCKIIAKQTGAIFSYIYQFLKRVAFYQFLGYITTAKRNVKCIEKMPTIGMTAFLNAIQ